MKFLYKYPQSAFPYKDLRDENARRGKQDKEYQILDTGCFEDDKYWDIIIETAKDDEDPDELLFRVTAWNRGPEPKPIHILPHVWFRNTWAWGREPKDKKPSVGMYAENMAKSKHHSLGERYMLLSPSPGVGPSGDDVDPEMLFTENDTNFEVLYDGKNPQPYVKDAFHRYIVDGEKDAVNPAQIGTKTAAWYKFNEAGGVPPGECAGKFQKFVLWSRLRLTLGRLQLFVFASPRRPRRIWTKRFSTISLSAEGKKPMTSTTALVHCPCQMICATYSGKLSPA